MRIKPLVVTLLLAVPCTAQADLFSAWIAAKGAVQGGSSDIRLNLDGSLAAGLEAGLSVIGITLYGEGLLLGSDQYEATLNLGFQFHFGEEWRFGAGVFTGPLLLYFPERIVSTGLHYENLNSDERAALLLAAMAAGYDTLDDLNSEYAMAASQERDISRLGFGWNLIRLRLDFEYQVVSFFYVGILGQLGYHLFLSGADVAAGAKNQAIQEFASDNNLSDDVKDLLLRAAGAKPVDKTNLDGFNYDLALYVKLEF